MIEFTFRSMVVTVTLPTGIDFISNCRLPLQVIVKVFTFFAVLSFRMMSTLAFPVNHKRDVWLSRFRDTSTGMTITRALSSHDHFGNCIVVLFFDLRSLI